MARVLGRLGWREADGATGYNGRNGLATTGG
jgi:hypothetical protein